MTERRTIFSLSWLKDSSCLTVIGVLVSGAALALSFAGLSAGLPFDAAWAAIALCGAPIVAGAARALVREGAPYSNPEPSQTSTWLRPTVNGMYKSSAEITGTYRKNACNLS